MDTDTGNALRPLRIVRSDVNKMNFVRFPFELTLLNNDAEATTERIRKEIADGSYRFSPSSIAEVPKGKGAVRPGSIITLEDQLAYNILIEEALPEIRSEIQSTQGVVDFGYELYSDDDQDYWFRQSYSCWKRWGINSIDTIADGYGFVVMTDITGCYENLDIKTLFLDLGRIGVAKPITDQLRKALKSWGQIESKGIPQGVSASHMLAKLYLSQVDIEMRDSGYKMTRYVDDIRIFCKSSNEAKLALMTLSSILRKRGLNLQSSKSKILKTVDAIREIEGQAAVIAALQDRLVDELDDIIIGDDPYAARIAVNTGIPNSIQLSHIKHEFTEYYLKGSDNAFDKSLFHYLLNRLSAAGDDFAAYFCLDNLDNHPEETSFILGYLGKVTNADTFFDRLTSYLASGSSVYDYQNFLVCEWLLEQGCLDSVFIDFARTIAFDHNKPAYYRALAKSILGKNGKHTDLIKIKDALPQATSSQERNALVCSLVSLIPEVRNALLKDLEQQLQVAVSFVRQA
ncbi:RNA-directed DNA polymerase [Candidatus Saccharibacteria bacterium]|nr:RNA-directed DNA polymerase [Candidatus Saccharibacteria bacterium]